MPGAEPAYRRTVSTGHSPRLPGLPLWPASVRRVRQAAHFS